MPNYFRTKSNAVTYHVLAPESTGAEQHAVCSRRVRPRPEPGRNASPVYARTALPEWAELCTRCAPAAALDW